MKTRILFRTDGDNKTGLGHLIRSFSLASMLQQNFDCTFAVRKAPDAFITMLENSGISVLKLSEDCSLHYEAHYLSKEVLTGKEIIVTDGYHFDTEYQSALKRSGSRLVCIDDIHSVHFLADVLINHSSGISEKDYSAEAYTRFCLGFDYLLLRPAFLRDKISSKTSDVSRVFVCLGGADPDNRVTEVLQHLENIPWVEQCITVIGAAYLHRNELSAFCRESRLSIEVFENIDAEQMADLMRSCGTAVTPPSTVALEYLVCGANLFITQTADNQVFLKDYLLKNEIAFDLAELPQDIDKIPVPKLENRPDGKSTQRLRRVFFDLEKTLHCRLRRAQESDLLTCFAWANDPETKKQSFRQHEISLEEHSSWFLKKIKCPHTFYYILEYKGAPAGQIRFDLDENAVLSFAMDKNHRGIGLGTWLLKNGADKLRADLNNNIPITGLVKAENTASNRTFSKLGYRKTKYKEQENVFCYTSP